MARPSAQHRASTRLRTAARSRVAGVLVLPLAATAIAGAGGLSALSGSDGSVTRAMTMASAPAPHAVDGLSLPVRAVDPAVDPTMRLRPGSVLEPRSTVPSRSSVRGALGPEVAPVKVKHRRYATQAVNVRTGPGPRYKQADFLRFRQGLGTTGLRSGKWVQVKLDKRSLWVHSDFLVAKRPPKPKPEPVATTGSSSGAASSSSSSSASSSSGGVDTSACGTSVSGGANLQAVHNAVCHLYPSISTYGTYRADSPEHASGHAIDIMVSGSTGYAVADYVRAHAAELGVSEVIYSQTIWTVERSGEGWRPMEDRGSTTANHYDHVHVTTY